MELYIGGYAQGKLTYVTDRHPGEKHPVWDGATETFPGRTSKEAPVCNHYHLWVKRLLKDGADVRARGGELLLEHPDCIIISDEIGNGCELANKADRVERIVCGIGERIK